MRVYAVFEPPAKDAVPSDDLVKHAERFRFVRDGFSWSAFLFTPIWMLRYRLWLVLVIYIAILGALVFATARGRVPQGLEGIAVLLLNLLVGFESATVRRRKLQRWGWRDLGIVVAENLQAAEQRFFDRWVTHLSAAGSTDAAGSSASTLLPAVPASSQPEARADNADSYALGMLPTPGGSR
jgi:hypothetical protein